MIVKVQISSVGSLMLLSTEDKKIRNEVPVTPQVLGLMGDRRTAYFWAHMGNIAGEPQVYLDAEAVGQKW